jgi:type IV secretory pathway protease TraF
MIARMRVAVVVAVILAVLAAGSAGAATPSPCKLVTVAEVKAAFGGTVGAGKVEAALASAPTCHFQVKHSNLGVDGEAVVFITPGQSAATFKLAKKYVPGAVTVTGVGTAAFYNPHTTSIELLKGNAVASAQGIFFGANAAKAKADVIVLAKAVAKRL